MPKIRPDHVRKAVREAAVGPLTRSENEVEEKRATLFTKVDSLDDTERAWAVNSLARLITEDAAVFKLVVDSNDVLQRIVQRLSDSSLLVRRAAAGVIHNALIVGEAAMANKLISCNISAAIQGILEESGPLSQRAQQGATESDDEAAQPAIVEDLLVQSLSYTSLLCEFIDVFAERLLNGRIMDTLLPLCLPKIGTLSIQISAATLMRTLVESTTAVSRYLNDSAMLQLKIVIANQQHPFPLRVQLIAVLASTVPLGKHVEELFRVCLPSIHQAISFDSASLLNQIAASPSSKAALGHDSIPSDLQIELMKWKQAVVAQATAFEILANVLVDGDDDMDVEEMEDLDEDGNGGYSMGDATSEKLDADLLRYFVSETIFSKSLARCSFVDPSLLPLRQLPPLINCFLSLNDVQVRALSVVANAIDVLPESMLGDRKGIWDGLFDLARAATSRADSCDDIVECVVLAMHSLARRVSLEFSSEHFVSIMQLSRHSAPPIAVHTIGIMGVFLSVSLGNHQIVEPILRRLIDGLSSDSDLVLCECLNVIFERFDDHHDELVRSLDLIPALRRLVPALLEKAQLARKSKDRVLFDRLDEAKVNLTRFIKYKEKQGKGF